MAYTNINKPSDYFNTKLYTGNGSTQSITGINFQPDMVWTKIRNGVYDHNIFDAIRGVTKDIRPNVTNAEGTQSGGLTSFDSDGYSLGSWVPVNESSSNYVSWNWLANGAGVSNTDGSITSTVSANTISGFSIVKYTGDAVSGATVGHGLGAVPKMVIIKSLDNAATPWVIYHASLGNTKKLYFDTASEATTSNWASTSPTSSVFTISGSEPNASGENFIAYCFAEKKGFSKFGSYVGNGIADGTFVYTGFKPAFVIQKHYSGAATEGWQMWDAKRNPYNLTDLNLSADMNGAEFTATARAIDILSNGFKCRGADNSGNASGQGYIYMAFAENPLVSSTGVPCTAR